MVALGDLERAVSAAIGAGENGRRRAAERLARDVVDVGDRIAEPWAELEHARAAELGSRYRAGHTHRDGRMSRPGGGQCGGCKAPRGHARTGPCPHCGFFDRAGYVSVPAPTSHVERWR